MTASPTAPPAAATLPAAPHASVFRVPVPGGSPIEIIEQVYPAVGLVRYSCRGPRVRGMMEICARYDADLPAPVGAELILAIRVISPHRRDAFLDHLTVNGVELTGTSFISTEALTDPADPADPAGGWRLTVHRLHGASLSDTTHLIAKTLLRAVAARWRGRPDRLGLLAANSRHTAPGRLALLRREPLRFATDNAARALSDVAVHHRLESELAALAGEPPADPGSLRVWVARVWTSDVDAVTLHGSRPLAVGHLAEWVRHRWAAHSALAGEPEKYLPNDDERTVDRFFHHALPGTGHMIYHQDVPDAVPRTT